MERQATLPRYQVLAETLKAQMRSLAHNSLLPTEEQLAKRFSVSRVTIRQALNVLERGGLIDRQRGRGTIVNPPKVTRTMWPPLLIEEDFSQQGISMQTDVLSVEQDPILSDRIGLRLKAQAIERVARISLLRQVEDRVICYDCRYLPGDICDRLDLSRVGEIPISVLITQCVETPVTDHHWDLQFEPSSIDEARVLNITPGTLVVVSTGTHYLRNGAPLWITEISYRIDRVKFFFTSRHE